MRLFLLIAKTVDLLTTSGQGRTPLIRTWRARWKITCVVVVGAEVDATDDELSYS